ncbi:unnamed protein product [Miscanthus lutarioriparius]|uniref:Uncharacterized protein n=1 Tax=Miscanthus lutarioriparius TaxID=422564 RepID=A0A811RP80_9POAL|nr:unnamed protein product [Miscanthus lutarioriparius]
MSTQMKVWLEAFSNDPTKRMDKVSEHLINVDARLSNMEQGGSKDDADTAAVARAKLEHKDTTKDLEVETKRAMGSLGMPSSRRR